MTDIILTIHFGAMAKDVNAQLKEQGVYIPDNWDRLRIERLHHVLNKICIVASEIFTTSECQNVRKRLIETIRDLAVPIPGDDTE